MKVYKIIYWVSSILLSVQMIFSASIFIFKNGFMKLAFTALDFPIYLIYPIAITNILGVIALLLPIHKTIKEWAYAGICYNLILAISAHVNSNDGQLMASITALALLVISYISNKIMLKKVSTR